MPRRYDEYKKDLNNVLRDNFQENTPTIIRENADNPLLSERLVRLHQKQLELRQAMVDGRAETRDLTIRNDVVALWDQRQANLQLSPMPSNSLDVAHSNKALREEAAQKYDAETTMILAMQQERFTEELQREVDTFHRRKEVTAEQKQSAENTMPVAAAPKPEVKAERDNTQTLEIIAPTKHFKASSHAIFERADQARDQAREIFFRERDALITEAERNGADEPERDVTLAFKESLRQIDVSVHKDFDRLCRDHGYSKEKQEILFHAAQEQAPHERLAEIEQSEQIETEQISEVDAPSFDQSEGFSHDD